MAVIKGKFRVLTASAAVVAAFGVGVLAAVAASASTAGAKPPWESSVHPNGTLTFYNSSGKVVTGGKLTSAGLAAYAVASTAGKSGYDKATLFVYTPVSGSNPAKWSGEQISSSTNYPNTSAPGVVGKTKNPVETNAGSDTSIANYILAYPNTSKTKGYVGLYDVRMRISGQGIGFEGTYWDAVIAVNTTKGTWSLDYPDTVKVVTKPKVSGPHEPGKAEKVTAGTWFPGPVKVSYQWYIGSTKEKGATKSSFTVPKSTKKGSKVHCVVKAAQSGYATGSYTTPSVKIT